MNLKEQYQRDGFAILKGVFSAAEVADLRKKATEIFSRPPTFAGDRVNIRQNWTIRYPELSDVMIKDKFLSGMKELLGEDFLILPETGLHDSCLLGGWHRDTGAQEKAGHFFHFAPNYQIAAVAIYLQDNHPEYGGGLDIVPGSHRTRPSWWQKQKSGNSKVKFVLTHLDRRGLIPKWVLDGRKGSHSIPSKAGDVLVFNTLSDHRPTHPRVEKIPESNRKFGLFLICSANNEHAKNFVEFTRSRHDGNYLTNYSYPAEYLNRIVPAKFHLYTDDKISLS